MIPSLLPVLYLNPLEHQGKTYIKFWHKPHPLLRQKLKEASWIKYSKTYQCFVIHHSPQALAQTQHYFTGIATINTRYLYRPKRLQPTERTMILASDPSSAKLQKRAEQPVVHLAPLVTVRHRKPQAPLFASVTLRGRFTHRGNH